MNVIKLIQPLYAKDLQLKNKCNSLESRNKNLEINNSRLSNELSESREENKMLHSQVNDLNRAKIILGAKVVNDAIQVAKQHEERVIQRRTISRRHSQDLGR
jgi:predicted nuclease with TOPRIM domain